MRPATQAETDAAIAFLESVDEGLAAKVMGVQRLAVCDRDGGAYACLVSPDVLELPAALRDTAGAAGLPIGTLEGTDFHLDLQGAVLMARHTKSQTVRVTEHASRLFLYGRNILGESVEWHDASLEAGAACIVTNPRGEAVGIGVVVGSFKGPREAVRPVHDLGTYLRDQGEGE
ncbi:MAG: hypothetical protein V4510_07540 [bacterium]